MTFINQTHFYLKYLEIECPLFFSGKIIFGSETLLLKSFLFFESEIILLIKEILFLFTN
jgi:hypothetical protein